MSATHYSRSTRSLHNAGGSQQLLGRRGDYDGGHDDDHERDEGMIEKSGFSIWRFTNQAWARLAHCMHGYWRPTMALKRAVCVPGQQRINAVQVVNAKRVVSKNQHQQ